jgi:hypothetical protein
VAFQRGHQALLSVLIDHTFRLAKLDNLTECVHLRAALN